MTQNNVPVKVALIGLGWWGRKMTVVLQKARQDIEIVCAAEPNPAGAAFAKEHGFPCYPDDAAALKHSGVEAVILATPHSLHAEQIERAVAARKHIFCEKPLALTRAGAEKAVNACAAKKLVLGMGHERRFEPPVAAMIAAAQSGALGRLLQIEANFSHDKFVSLDASNWRLNPAEAPVGGMTATGIHLTDLSTLLLGPARDVRVSCEKLASNIPQGDTMSAHIRFKNGGTAYISATLATPFISRFALFGTKGWIDIRDKAHVESPAGWVVTSANTGSEISVKEIPPAEPVKDNLVAFAHAIRGKAAYQITGEELINNISILEAIIASAAQDGAIVNV
ncbi:Gfo/Idh/MocA family protein [Aestuariivirga litoralis]|uniref:Gfo/Idh/MocA family protein n=1 Tax=Aestuariivirga litoralis TaxID=2650924 RepID=UPI0018C59B54|nr:Gfo/Idh/MocA family oxidoreductase [Aestuariivirga litoralis]MBG1231062.1 Gfo/Idh/MocA family oxidoreductase [Aestuariivirga litoralis]